MVDDLYSQCGTIFFFANTHYQNLFKIIFKKMLNLSFEREGNYPGKSCHRSVESHLPDLHTKSVNQKTVFNRHHLLLCNVIDSIWFTDLILPQTFLPTLRSWHNGSNVPDASSYRKKKNQKKFFFFENWGGYIHQLFDF